MLLLISPKSRAASTRCSVSASSSRSTWLPSPSMRFPCTRWGVQNQPGEYYADTDQPSHLFFHARNLTYRFPGSASRKTGPGIVQGGLAWSA